MASTDFPEVSQAVTWCLYCFLSARPLAIVLIFKLAVVFDKKNWRLNCKAKSTRITPASKTLNNIYPYYIWWDLRNVNKNNFLHEFQTINWDNLFNRKSIDEKFKILIKETNEIIDRNATLRSKQSERPNHGQKTKSWTKDQTMNKKQTMDN